VSLPQPGQTLTVDEVTYPGTDGTAGQVLTTDGAGSATFQDVSALDETTTQNETQVIVTAVQTSDATPTVCGVFTLVDDQAVIAEVHVVGIESDGSDRAAHIHRALVYRDGAGATMEGSLENTFLRNSAGASGWASSLSVSGNDLRCAVVGEAATTINWRTRLVVVPT
jgi:hypothetical protein